MSERLRVVFGPEPFRPLERVASYAPSGKSRSQTVHRLCRRLNFRNGCARGHRRLILEAALWASQRRMRDRESASVSDDDAQTHARLLEWAG